MFKSAGLKYLLILPVLVLSSCLSSTSSLSLNSDGSGSLILNYRINKQASGIRKDSSPADGRLIPLPVSEMDFLQRVSRLPGIVLIKLQTREDLDYIFIDSEMEFASLRDLSEMTGISLDLTDNAGRRVLAINILDQNQPVLPQTMKYLTSLVNEDRLTFSIEIPGTVRESSFGQISSDGTIVTYSLRLEDLYRNSSFLWNIEWE